MTTVIEKTIGTGGDYSTIALWAAAVPTDLVAADQIWRGLLLNQEHLITGGKIVLTNRVTSAACYWELTTAPGHSIFDPEITPDLALLPLRYGTVGARIKMAVTGILGIDASGTTFWKMSKVQFIGTGTGTNAYSLIYSTSGGCDIDRCIFEGDCSNTAGLGSVVRLVGSAQRIRNSLVLSKSTTASANAATLQGGASAYNTVIAAIGGTTLTNVVSTSGTGGVLKNCYIAGGTNPISSAASHTKTTCYTDVSGASGFATPVVPLSASTFVSVTNGTHDFRLASGSLLINAGTADATYSGTDIYGTARPQDVSYDVGAWEFSAPASAPTITDPSNVTQSVGASATFTVNAAGNPLPTLQWQVSTDGGANWSNISGATSASYNTGTLASSDNGKKFRCVATSTQGTATSAAATLTVQIVAPSITTPPQTQSVNAGSTAVFTVAASGSAPLTYQWQLSTDGGTTWGNISGATSLSYTTPTLVTADSGKRYRCVVSNESGTPATSSAAILTVNAVAPGITQQPQSVSKLSGETATFTVAATNAASFQWERMPSGGSWAAISGATSASYTTPATTVSGGSANSGDQYRCVITSSSGGVTTSSAATLTVNASAVAPSVTTHPVSQTVTAGAQVTFTAAFSGTGTITYQWQRLPTNGTWTDINGATSASYTTPATTVSGGEASNADQFRCVGSNGTLPDAITNPATLTVNAPTGSATITTPPLKNNTGTLLANISGWTVNVYNATTGAPVIQKTGLSTDASGVLAINDPALVAGTTYTYEPVHLTYGRRLPTGVAA